MLKKDSEAWKLAKKISRRKHCFWEPIALSATKPETVIVQSVIRGNTWEKSIEELRLIK